MLDSLAAELIDDPWADEELPSLVATDEDGQLSGFIAAHVRRMRFEERELRAVCCSHLTVAPGRRGGAAGALLLRRLLTGAQDLTFSHTANPEVTRMWRTFGGYLDHARACDWMVALRPGRWLRLLATDTVMRRDLGRGQIPVGAFPFQAVRRHSGRWAFPEPESDVTGADVDPAGIVERLPDLTRGFRLWVDYTEDFLSHLFAQVESQYGQLTKRLVRRGDRPLGWYAYVCNPSGIARVLHLLAPGRDEDADAVLADLVADARGRGAAILAGRNEPHLTAMLQRRLPVLGFAQRPVVHCHDPEILAAIASEASLLTRLDGEWFVS